MNPFLGTLRWSTHDQCMKSHWRNKKLIENSVRANTLSVFHYTNCDLKFQKLQVPKGKVTSTCHADPTQATARLVIVLVNRMGGTGDHDLVKWKGTLRSDRPKCPHRSKLTPSKAACKYSGRTEPKWTFPYDVQPNFLEFWGWMKSALWRNRSQRFQGFIQWVFIPVRAMNLKPCKYICI